MNLNLMPLRGLLVCLTVYGTIPAASAQDAAAPATPAAPARAAPAPAPKPVGKPTAANAQIDAGEPRADTSSAAALAAPAAPAAAQAPKPQPSSASKAHTPEKGQKTPGAVDRLDLGAATVTGDREQPKVMYIVPWKRSDIGDLSGKPMNSLLDEALAPVDRDEFKREVAYYDAVKSDASHNGASSSAQGEK